MQLANQVKLAISEVLKIPVDRLQDNTQLDELGAESLDFIEIVYALEEKFDVDIALEAGRLSSKQDGAGRESDLSQFSSIGDVCRLVQRLVDSKVAQ
jgi:acyl carrier protein